MRHLPRLLFAFFTVLLGALSFVVPVRAQPTLPPPLTGYGIPVYIMSEPLGGRATFDTMRRPIIRIDSKLAESAPPGGLEFVIQHELAHHRLGHVSPGNAVHAFLDPAFSRQQEAEADDYACRVLVAQGHEDQLQGVADWNERILSVTPDHPLPKERVAMIRAAANKLKTVTLANDPDAARFVVLDDSDIQWNTNGFPPTARVKLVYINTGDYPIDVKMILASGHVPRDAPRGDDSEWKPFDNTLKAFRLEPGQKTTVQTTLMWYRDADTMPRLKLPSKGKGMAMMGCQWVGKTVQKNPLEQDFKTLIAAIPSAFASLRGRLKANEEYRYHSKLLLQDAVETEISHISRFWTYEAVLIRTPDAQAAKVRNAELVTLLQRCIPTSWERDDAFTAESQWHSPDRRAFAAVESVEYGGQTEVKVTFTQVGDEH